MLQLACDAEFDALIDVDRRVSLAHAALHLDRTAHSIHDARECALAYILGDLDDGAALIDRALALNPNLAAAWLESGFVRAFLGEPDLAIEHLMYAMRLSPLDRMQAATAQAHFFAGRYDKASSWAGTALRDQPDYTPAFRIAAASNALAGRIEQAQKALTRLRQLDPTLRVSNLRERMGPYRPEDVVRYEEGLRKAGLPE